MNRTYYTDIIQGTDEWKDLRRGFFTSSQTKPFMAEPAKFRWEKKQIQEALSGFGIEFKSKDTNPELIAKLPEGFAEKHATKTQTQMDAIDGVMNDKLAELMGCPIDEPRMPWWVERGNECEPDARAAFESETGLEVEQVGFVAIDGLYIGDSPDGLINGRKECLEIKVPLDKTHIGYIRNHQKFLEDHEYQVHHHLAVLGCDVCHCYSWNPNPKLPPVYFKVVRSSLTEDILKGLLDMDRKLKQELEVYRSIYSSYRESLESKKSLVEGEEDSL